MAFSLLGCMGCSDEVRRDGPNEASQEDDTSDPQNRVDGGEGGDIPAALIRVHYDVGFSNAIAIRGSGAGLSWAEGKEALWTEGNVWELRLDVDDGSESDILFKPTIQTADGQTLWAKGVDYRIRVGETVTLVPTFYQSSGAVERFAMWSDDYGAERLIDVYLPPGYSEEGAAHRAYPIFFFLDGQNLFGEAAFFGGWQLDQTLDSLHAYGTVQTAEGVLTVSSIMEAIIVAPHNSANRIYEYTPSNGSFGDCDASVEQCGGGGEAHLQFLAGEVRAEVQARYRVTDDILGIGGSSLGGLLSLYACWVNPDIFPRCAAHSPSLWWDEGALLEEITEDPEWMGASKIYLDVGTEEGMFEDVLLLERIFSESEAGELGAAEWTCIVGDGHGHQETAWRERVPHALLFLLEDTGRVREEYSLPQGLSHCHEW